VLYSLSREIKLIRPEAARSERQKAPSAIKCEAKVNGKSSKTVFRYPKLQQEQVEEDITGLHDAKFEDGDKQQTNGKMNPSSQRFIDSNYRDRKLRKI